MAEKRQQINDTDNTGYLSEAISIARTPADDKNAKQIYTTEHSGWYYDQQLIQPLTSVRLKANTFAKWDKDHWKFTPFDDYAYEELLASSILAEDFQIDVANNWIDNDMGDMIGGFLNSFKTASPYLGVIQDALRKMSESQKATGKVDAAADRGLNVTKGIAGIVDYFGNEESNGAKLIKSAREAANGHFVTQGCSFTYYSGTNVNFGNMGMRFTIFPTYATDGKWKTVQEQVALLLPYCIGILQDVPTDLVQSLGKTFGDITNLAGEVGTSVKDFLSSVTNTVVNSVGGKSAGELINHYIKWQAAPGGYDLNKPENVDAIMPGTLCLEIGSHYKIESLVISNINLNFSKQLVKNPEYFGKDSVDKNTIENAISPLYCDVNLLLRPISKYSSTSLMRFINGNVEGRKQSATNILETLNKSIEEVSNNSEK